jgi:AAA+ ATPase superfamily predicted ATPase
MVDEINYSNATKVFVKYKLVNDPITNELSYIKKIFEDVTQNIYISIDESNSDYIEYQRWVSDGNTAEAADPSPDAE